MHTRKVIRCDFLLSPILLGSLALILFNDLILKPHYPSSISGLLSDLAGMVFFPIWLVALAEWASALFPRRPLASPTWFVVSTVVVAVLFVTMKYTAIGHEIYEWAVSPILGVLPQVLSLGAHGVTSDPWDLVALLLIPAPIFVGVRYRGKRNAAQPVG